MTPTEAELAAAGRSGTPVAFDYRKETPDWQADVIQRRVVIPDPEEPIRTNADGRRYVIGEDLARGEPRSFHTDRIDRVSVSP